MQCCVQNITTVRYLLDLYEQHSDVTHIKASSDYDNIRLCRPRTPTPSLSHSKH